jgi:peptidoglycan DL-endopeptidase CwlO
LRNARRLQRALVLSAVFAGFIIPASAAVASPTPQSITKQIDAANAEFDKIVDQYDSVNQQLKSNLAAAATLQKQIAPAMLAAQVAQAKIGEFAAKAYIAGPITTLSALISADNTTDMINTMSALNEVAYAQNVQVQADQKTIATYQTEKTKLDNLVSVETAQRTSLAAQKVTIKKKITALYALRTKAYGHATVKTGTGSGQKAPPAAVAGRGGKIVAFAYKQLGKRYVYATDGPSTYDCSGLVLAAYRTVGVSLPHNTTAQWDYHGKAYDFHDRGALEPGDIVFYQAGDIHHVAIYIGGGKVIHAPEPGDVVKISGISMMSTYGYSRP